MSLAIVQMRGGDFEDARRWRAGGRKGGGELAISPLACAAIHRPRHPALCSIGEMCIERSRQRLPTVLYLSLRRTRPLAFSSFISTRPLRPFKHLPRIPDPTEHAEK